MSNKAEEMTIKQDVKRELKPNLRFPEFLDAPQWTKKPLEEILLPIVRERTKPVEAYTGLGLRSHGKGTFLKNLENPDKNSMEYLYEVQCDDLIVNITFAWEGAIAIAKSTDTGALVSHRFPTYEFKRDSAIPDFFRYIILDKQFVYKLGVISPGGAGRNRVLNKNDFLKLRVILPEVSEQQKVADCLTNLDELIAAHGHKLDTLKTHKSGLMQQLFPRAGEALPSLRFPEFQGGGLWAEKKLGEIADILMCKRIFAEETNDRGGVPFYKIGTLGGKPDAFISEELFHEYRSKYNYPRKGEILITCSGTVGKCLPFDGKEAYYQDSNIVWIDNPAPEVSNEFMLQILINVDWGKLNSTTITRIYGPDLRNLLIRFPVEKTEQQRVADSLSSLDDLITSQAQELEALKTHKKGLMQQLFPSQEEVEA